ncbi:MAG: metallopeptidase family protein [Caldilineaceae bacterium]|nr:metallopeptidase family protein [Caldilineaceae bacterium]
MENAAQPNDEPANDKPSLEAFETLVEQALAEIPDALWNKIDNVAVVVEDWPSPQQLASVGLGHRHLLLGLYEGVPLTARTHAYGLVTPDKITIFRGPILRVCPPDANAIRAQVRRTVLHEIAHHFGISDDRLHELGAY